MLLAEAFLKRYSVILNKDVVDMSSEVKEALVERDRKLSLIEQNEKSTIIEGLIKCNGNISKTADLIGIGRRSLYRRLEYYGINSSKYRTKTK